MARRENDLFIGADNLTMDGANIKYYGLIKYFASINMNKIDTQPIELIGLDIETNHLTGELRLLGFYSDSYDYYLNDFLENLFMYVKYCYNNGISLAYWNRLDSFILFKLFLEQLEKTEEGRNVEIPRSLYHYGKISGEYSKKESRWIVRPVVTITTNSGVEFGILNVIRSSIQFYYKTQDDDDIKTIWAFDIATLYHYGLEREAMGKLNEKTGKYEGTRLSYYTKVDESAHLIDWDRFKNDKYYRENIVLKSNMLDSKAVKDLGYIIQDEFYNAFGKYPRSLVSQGSLARAAIVAKINDMHIDDNAKAKEDIQAIGVINFYDKWVKQFGDETVKELMSITTEAYSGGYIESTRYGYIKEGYYSDIASAYPAITVELYDLRGCNITMGNGEPPIIENSYCFIRGTVNIPKHVNYHSITVKNPISNNTNIRATGTYVAAYIKEERDYLISLGATFGNEKWVNIETKGILSPLAKVARQFIDLRTKLIAENNSAEYMAKIAVNSMYGILFEAVDTYKEYLETKEIDVSERFSLYRDKLKYYRKNINFDVITEELKILYDKDFYNKIKNNWYNKNGVYIEDVFKDLEYMGIYLKGDNITDNLLQLDELWRNDVHKPELKTIQELVIKKEGYRAGEFFNPIFATYITAKTRLKLARLANHIESNGGKVILLMTDSVFWKGSKDLMIKEMCRDVKTLGYFETPEKITDFICLGSGRYGYTDKRGRKQTKQRGLNSAEIHNKNGGIIEDFDWYETLKNIQTKNNKVKLIVKALISVGYVNNNNVFKYWENNEEIEKPLSWRDLGRVVKTVRELDVIVGKAKREFRHQIKDYSILANELLDTTPIHIESAKFGYNEVMDLSYKNLRGRMLERSCLTQIKKNKERRNKNAKKYYNDNQESKKAQLKENYKRLRKAGYGSYEAGRLSQRSEKEIKRLINKRKK